MIYEGGFFVMVGKKKKILKIVKPTIVFIFILYQIFWQSSPTLESQFLHPFPI